MPESTSAGLQAIRAEMSRQGGDALASFENAGEAARAVAESAGRTGRLLLLGMGGSHAVNRTVEPLYRRAEIDTTAIPVSELLHAPLPARARTVLLASQSGESAEIVRYLDHRADVEERFGLTLDPGSRLARTVPSLVGHGGVEEAFAATRSLTVSLALHGRVLQEMGFDQADALQAARAASDAEIGAAAELLSGKNAVVFSGRAAFQGIAEAGALGLMELARIPCFALEGGQLRHGPVEALGPHLGVVLIRAAGAAPELTAGIAELCIAAGGPPVILDASGLPPVPGAVTVPLPKREDLAAALTVLPAMQRLMIEVATRKVADAGTPIRATKVTRVE
jgi:fructoselysine-6-P-deglycase FrlB-like protein